MSNKTSDKNVGSIDEKAVNDDIELIKNLIENNKIEIKNVSVGQEFRLLRTLQNILAEREQQDKRIKELEEENYIQKIQIYENSILKQTIIDKIEELKKRKDKYEYETQEIFSNAYYDRKRLEIIHKIDVLQELLERGK